MPLSTVTGYSVYTKAVFSDASCLSLPQSQALCFGKEEYFLRKAPVGSFNAEREEGLVFILHLVIIYHIAEKHFGKWRLIPCAFIDCRRNQPWGRPGEEVTG